MFPGDMINDKRTLRVWFFLNHPLYGKNKQFLRIYKKCLKTNASHLLKFIKISDISKRNIPISTAQPRKNKLSFNKADASH